MAIALYCDKDEEICTAKSVVCVEGTSPYPLYLIYSDKWALADMSYLYAVDFHLVVIQDLLHLHFVLTLAKTPHLRQGMNTWVDELRTYIGWRNG
ncbi:hypothetical protein Y032_0738g1952 [Ancylostoma ceylanicum]|uniref:Uncharacterized protein n=1 Tax=Ancylostoma ceylanicum TaxID=53326 RepID=A0A016WEY2_9BILA|nr:hypothetical protein Y032_0738g1952 [Ancylostoma ceylanicum]